ncbi:N-acyl-D-glutamate deacylase [Sporomusa rhizae]|uniref:N-acyl-D-amino-acid deacylase family protein n=1 Tax=Sporomusa rhizae TaxID=357999 RepID=UPI00352A9601
MFETVINNGHVIDPASKISAKLNIGIAGGKIVHISDELLAGINEIDAKGRIVSPGFIDIHIHEDEYNESKDECTLENSNALLKMGVTTAIAGNCGIPTGCDDPVKYLEVVDRIRFPINLAMLSPQYSLRKAVGIVDEYQTASKEEISTMANVLEDHLKHGCYGVSMGIEYMPGTSSEEIEAMMKVASRFGCVTAIHMRDGAKKSISSLYEMIKAAELENATLQISHIGSMCGYGQMERALAIIDASRAKGLNISFDCYPYAAYCTDIGSAAFDDGFMEGYELSDDGYFRLEVAIGKYAGTRCTKELFMKLRESEPNTLLIGHLMNENEVDMALSHPACIIGSDVDFINGQGHPRGIGTFPRFISEHVKNKKLLSIEQALEKMTFLPAQRYGLPKGTLKVGSDADITIFDLNKIKDQATYQNPLREPEGIDLVLMGGKVALRQSAIVNGKLGKTIRK